MEHPALMTHLYAGRHPVHDVALALAEAFPVMDERVTIAVSEGLLGAGSFITHYTPRGGVIAWLVVDADNAQESAQLAAERAFEYEPVKYFLDLPPGARVELPDVPAAVGPHGPRRTVTTPRNGRGLGSWSRKQHLNPQAPTSAPTPDPALHLDRPAGAIISGSAADPWRGADLWGEAGAPENWPV